VGAKLARAVSISGSARTVVSLMAGISTAKIREVLGPGYAVVRTMPNLPLTVGKGAVAIASDGLAPELVREVQELFAAVGTAVVVREAQLDAVTGLSGSGPAWVFQFLEGMIQGGVKAGLPRDLAEQLTYATVEGSMALVRAGGENPAALTAKVCSPGGTTIHGLHALEQAGFRSALMDAVEQATERSRVLGS